MKNKLLQYALHGAGWILFFSPIVIFVFRTPDGNIGTSKLFTIQFLEFCFIYMFVFYVNIYVLIPKLYLHKKYLYYFIAIALMFVAVYYVRPFDTLAKLNVEKGPPQPQPGSQGGLRPLPRNQIDIVSVVLFIMVLSSSSAICFIKQWQLALKNAARIETEKINAELSYLKAQINPHFLFNTLNSIYSLAIQKSGKTAEAVVKLSQLMRYVMTDATQHLVSLEQELDYINNYIELQKIRLEDTALINFNFRGNTTGKQIAPLILISFVENAFKHGVNPDENSKIDISISAKDHLEFFVSNKKVKNIFNDSPGMGIENAKTRLQVLYPGKYDLKITDDANTFTVQLTIAL